MTANRQSIDMKLGVSFDFFWHSIYSSSHSIRQYVLCLMLFLFPIFCVSGAKNVNSLTDSHKVNSRLNWGIEHWAQAYNNRKATADTSSMKSRTRHTTLDITEKNEDNHHSKENMKTDPLKSSHIIYFFSVFDHRKALEELIWTLKICLIFVEYSQLN